MNQIKVGPFKIRLISLSSKRNPGIKTLPILSTNSYGNHLQGTLPPGIPGLILPIIDLSLIPGL